MKLPCDGGKLPSQVRIGTISYIDFSYSNLSSLPRVFKPYQTTLDSISFTRGTFSHACTTCLAGRSR